MQFKIIVKNHYTNFLMMEIKKTEILSVGKVTGQIEL